MPLERIHFNRNRRMISLPVDKEAQKRLDVWAESASYEGVSYHKRSPHEFNLPQAGQPRRAKTLCDEVPIRRLADALRLLREGIRRGLVSPQERNGWPQHAWAVFNGRALEAKQSSQGVYHAYPLQNSDPFADEVIRRWNTKRE
ncbi:MAG TPA: hypothetical protein VG734_00260 [Lacunisphaera sp.]|nr:hypothetical protein [Lacunisphaera sp.]